MEMSAIRMQQGHAADFVRLVRDTTLDFDRATRYALPSDPSGRARLAELRRTCAEITNELPDSPTGITREQLERVAELAARTISVYDGIRALNFDAPIVLGNSVARLRGYISEVGRS